MSTGAISSHGLVQSGGKFLAEGIRGTDMDHHALAKERTRTVAGEIKKLIWDDDLAGDKVLAQWAAGADADDAVDAQTFQRPDIGTVVDFRGRQEVTNAMSGQKSHLAARKFAHRNGSRGLAKWSIRIDLFYFLQCREVVQPRSANNA